MADLIAFESDKNLELAFVPAAEWTPVERIAQPQAVFLTGATGFLGAFLLRELLRQTTADIYCLVRAAHTDEAGIRIRRNLEHYQLWDNRFQGRIRPVAGDLAAPLLGLSAKCFQTLAETIDVIHHNGALVNFAYPYLHLRAANVLGTLEILKLAASTRVKPLHFVSTLGVFSPADSQGKDMIDETASPEHGETLPIGYTQSKWMAERALVRARSFDLPICIHRPGRVAGDSRTGACQTGDFFWRLIRACIRMAKIPYGEGWVKLAPVDYVCQAIVYFSLQAGLLGKNFHYFNPHSMPMRQFIQWMRSYGYWLEHVSYEQWRANLIDIAALAPESNETSIAPFFWGGSRGADEGGYQLSCQNTLAALSGTSIVCPPMDAALLETYFSYFVRIGFLDAPVL